MVRLRRALIAGGAVVAVIGAMAWVFQPRPLLVETAQVTKGVFVATVEEDGRTRLRNRYVVSSPLAGRVLRSGLKPGDDVQQGTVVATLLPSLPPLLEARTRRELEERVGGAEAIVREAQARLDRAVTQEIQNRADVRRIRTLHENGIASALQLEREELALRLAQRDREAAELRRHAAEHELAQARVLLARSSEPDGVERWDVTAPVSGRVLQVFQESENAVAVGTPLVAIGDPGDLEVAVDLLTTDAVKVRPGADVVIDRWGGPGTLSGKVRLVEPAGFTKTSALGVEEQRVWVVIDFINPRMDWAGLGDAFRVNVRITTQEIPDATIAPATALFRRGRGWAVFVAEREKARERPVEVIGRNPTQVAIGEGLWANERVVVFPPSGLTDGGSIRAP